jgi:hypothetical protein
MISAHLKISMTGPAGQMAGHAHPEGNVVDSDALSQEWLRKAHLPEGLNRLWLYAICSAGRCPIGAVVDYFGLDAEAHQVVSKHETGRPCTNNYDIAEVVAVVLLARER